MKVLSRLLSMLFVASLITACSTNNDVVSHSLFVKHKHRGGFHLNLKRHAPPRESNSIHATSTVSQLEEGFALAAPTPQKANTETPTPTTRRTARSTSASAPVKSLHSTIRTHFGARKGLLKMESADPDEVQGNKFNKASKTQRRGRWALFFAFLEGACWLINLSSFLFVLSPAVLLVNVLFFFLFFGLAIGLGWKIKKRNDAAKWAVILAFGFILVNIAISVIGFFIGALFLL